MSRADWRREKFNALVQRVYQAIKSRKPWVKVRPQPVRHLATRQSARRSKVSTNTKTFTRRAQVAGQRLGGLFRPQLYWPIDPPAQSFSALLNWWNSQNPSTATSGRVLPSRV